MVTARDDPLDELQCFRLEADDYIIKPFRHPTVVVERVKAVLRRCRGRGASRIIRFENLAVDLDAYTACCNRGSTASLDSIMILDGGCSPIR